MRITIPSTYPNREPPLVAPSDDLVGDVRAIDMIRIRSIAGLVRVSASRELLEDLLRRCPSLDIWLWRYDAGGYFPFTAHFIS